MKRSKWLALASCGLLLLGACGKSDEKKETGEETADGLKPVLVYSNTLSEERGDWLTEKAEEAGFELSYVYAGAGETFNRLMSEKNAPQADVVIGLDESYHFQLLEEDLYVEYEPEWIGDIPEETIAAPDYFYPWSEERIIMIYNTEYVDEADAPENWQDLGTDSKFDEQYLLPPHLKGSTNQKAVLSTLLQYVDEDAESGISDEGWDEVESYYEHGYSIPESEDPIVYVEDGTTPIFYTWSSNVNKIEEEYDMTLGLVNPPQGVITMREQVAIMKKKDKDNYDVEKEFLDWFGSEDVQRAWSEEFNNIPVSEKAQDAVPERTLEVFEKTTPWVMDWDFIGKHINDWVERVELEIAP